jgi:MTH538 TIR-like domain (DUF1863)
MAQNFQRRRYSYWAFISYSRADEHWARSLHRSLESYRIRGELRPDPATVPSTQRLRPIFRDQDELAASADLGGRLHEALDRSRYLIAVASPVAAASKWVNAELQHFIDAERSDDIFLVVIGGDPGGAPEKEPIPAPLRSPGREPLWLDARSKAKPDRKTFIRLVAGMLNVGFDALWRRDRRRTHRIIATWTAATLLLMATVGGVIWQQRRISAENTPMRQVAAFRQYLVADILATARKSDPKFQESDVIVEIRRADDLNGDSLLDFFVFNQTPGFCGSGGCGMDVYLSEGRGSYREVVNLFGSTTPQTRDAEGSKYKEIVATRYVVESEPIYTVFRWTGKQYDLSHHEFCGGVWIEYCTPMIVMALDELATQRMSVAPDAIYRRAPEASASRTELQSGPGVLVGEVTGGEWYLVEIWKSQSGFVNRHYITQQ